MKSVAADQRPGLPDPSRASRPPDPSTLAALLDQPPRSFLSGVEWNLLYVSFVAYVTIITTYKIGGAQVAMGAALVGLVVQSRGFQFAPPMRWLAALLCWQVLGSLGGEFPEISGPAVFERMKLAVIGLVAVNALRPRQNIRFFLLFFAALYTLFPIRGGLVTYIIGGGKFGRTQWVQAFGNPNDLASLTIPAVAVVLGLLLFERQRSLPWFGAMAALPLMGILMITTQSRGAFIGLSTLLGPLLFPLMARARNRGRILVATTAVGALVVMASPPGMWKRVAGLTHVAGGQLEEVDPEGSAKERYEIWQTAIRIAADNPLFGAGVGTYPLMNARYSPKIGKKDTHSTYFNILAESGLIGLILLLCTFGSALRYANRVEKAAVSLMPRRAQQLRCLRLGIVGFLVSGIWISVGSVAYTYLYLGMLWAMAEQLRADIFRISTATV